MLDRVLVLSVSAGAGHVRAAQAVERAVAETGAARQVRHVDALDFTNRVFRRLYAEAYLEVVGRAPAVLGWLYDALDTPWERKRHRLLVDKLNARPLVRFLEEYRPDAVICTHFLPAEILSWLAGRKRLALPQGIVVTDFDVHAFWLTRHHERYFVALHETRDHLVKLGIHPARVVVSGIPIDPVFSRLPRRADARAKHGVDSARPVLLVSAGGFGMDTTDHLVRSLRDLEHAATVIVVCGKNDALRNRLRAALRRDVPSHLAFRVLGHTTEMHELMAASDLIVGKPGGLTVSEALAAGLVMVVVNPIPGQEERNSDHLLEEGAAIRCNNLPVLAAKIDRLLDDPARLAQLQRAARRLARPEAAFAVARELAAIAGARAAPRAGPSS